MPIYEYKCSKCNTTFEVLQRFTDPPLTTHDGCGGAVERLISPAGLHFKGSGWYITDYARKSGGNGGSAKKGESKEPAAKSEKADASAESSKS
ncbi:MAG TPA: zinc ribbon domain-containing protein [Bryobacteraceae bacterium]|nr:zinc ribbon domain-containing protein [Bryobacteraceae bacterium]HOL71521.1 zinc ribbon domain-containing protein [Bryobacteraceae bacterium]HOQ46324.1 zinc ribbon domain-containing protein [Bryobacteraceae bacterium]HPU72239.1 zinc ribbon domain-containing protein [Bryobacteraceae bacterium]